MLRDPAVMTTPRHSEDVTSFARSNLVAWGLLSCVLGVVLASGVSHLAPKFAEIFRGFGADLPAATAFVIRWPHLCWFLPIASGVLFWAAMRKREATLDTHGKQVLLFALLCASTAVIGALVMVALYMPILRMGAVV